VASGRRAAKHTTAHRPRPLAGDPGGGQLLCGGLAGWGSRRCCLPATGRSRRTESAR